MLSTAEIIFWICCIVNTVCEYQKTCYAITETTLLPTTDPNHPAYSNRQQQIGWKQMLYRRYAQQWINTINQQDPPINGHKFITKIIYLTWQQVVAHWKVRNSHLHPPTTENADQSWLRETVQQILHEAQQHPHLADMIGTIDIEQLMAKTTKSIQQFITRSQDHIRDHNQAEVTRARIHTHDIRSYFQRQAPTLTATATKKNLLQPP